MADADALDLEWERAGFVPDETTGSRLVPPGDTDYGMREFAVVDRSGNLIRVGSVLAPASGTTSAGSRRTG